jgi:hypothetical protein
MLEGVTGEREFNFEDKEKKGQKNTKHQTHNPNGCAPG